MFNATHFLIGAIVFSTIFNAWMFGVTHNKLDELLEKLYELTKK